MRTPNCPYCNNPVQISWNVELNMESYGRAVNAVSNCCGRILRLHPSTVYVAHEYTGINTEDDWGVPAEPKPLPAPTEEPPEEVSNKLILEGNITYESDQYILIKKSNG